LWDPSKDNFFEQKLLLPAPLARAPGNIAAPKTGSTDNEKTANLSWRTPFLR
jgi:hypothetical protein